MSRMEARLGCLSRKGNGKMEGATQLYKHVQ